MTKIFLLIVVLATVVTLGFGQTPGASSNTDQISIKGCLIGSDGNYILAEEGTSRTLKITSSTVDLKAQVGHEVELTGQKSTSAATSGAADNSLTVTAVNVISDKCTAATSNAPAETGTPNATASSAPAESGNTPAATASTMPAENGGTSAATTATPPAENSVTPPANTSAQAETGSASAVATSPSETGSTKTAASRSTAEDSTSTGAAANAARGSESDQQLPNTASSLPLLGLLGLSLMIIGLSSKRKWIG